jgi:hypothetical protein
MALNNKISYMIASLNVFQRASKVKLRRVHDVVTTSEDGRIQAVCSVRLLSRMLDDASVDCLLRRQRAGRSFLAAFSTRVGATT